MLLLFVVLPLVVQCRPVQKAVLPQDCEDIVSKGVLKSGVYTIYPAGSGKGLKVFCDMCCSEKSSLQAGKWTVIQRRMDGSVNFYRPWDDYKNGFGNKSGEYWIGLHSIYLLTYVYKYELRVDMEDFDGGRAYARYSSFSVEPESRNYRLQVNGYINGGAGDALSSQNGRDFYTLDRNVYGSCVDAYLGGFWYTCWGQYANPNGLYKWGTTDSSYTGMYWNTWKGNFYGLKSIVMKIRRKTLEEIED